MANELSFVLTSVSVVVTANSHNPPILTPDFLKSQGIVPHEWEVLDYMTSPNLSAVNYKERPQWLLDQGKLRILESCEGEFQDSYEVHDLAIKFIEKMRVVPYRSLGLNWQVFAHLEDPKQWLTKRFLSTEFKAQTPGDLRMEPQFSFRSNQGLPDAIVNISVNSGQVALAGEVPSDAVVIESNVHHQGPLDACSLIIAIGHWEIHQNSIRAALRNLFEGDQ